MDDLPPWITSPHPSLTHCLVAFPCEHVVVVTINRPEHANSLPGAASHELNLFWRWYDMEPGLRCAVLTGAGDAAFCAGMDLKERAGDVLAGRQPHEYPAGQFAGMTNRTGRKPIVVACNGHAHGGGFEVLLNADVNFATPEATFRLPEVLRGVSALAGALPRAMLLFGNHRTMDLVLTGRTMDADEAVAWGLVKELVPRGELLARAVEYAGVIASMSPDSVVVSRLAAREVWETGVSRATTRGQELWASAMMAGPNAAEGLAAFVEGRPAKWEASKL